MAEGGNYPSWSCGSGKTEHRLDFWKIHPQADLPKESLYSRDQLYAEGDCYQGYIPGNCDQQFASIE